MNFPDPDRLKRLLKFVLGFSVAAVLPVTIFWLVCYVLAPDKVASSKFSIVLSYVVLGLLGLLGAIESMQASQHENRKEEK